MYFHASLRGSNGKILTALTEGCRSKNLDVSTWNVCQGGMHEAHGAGGRTARATLVRLPLALWLRGKERRRIKIESRLVPSGADTATGRPDSVLARSESLNVYQA